MHIGMHRDELDKTKIKAATFHPFKDIWYVVYDRWFLVIIDRIVARIEDRPRWRFNKVCNDKYPD